MDIIEQLMNNNFTDLEGHALGWHSRLYTVSLLNNESIKLLIDIDGASVVFKLHGHDKPWRITPFNKLYEHLLKTLDKPSKSNAQGILKALEIYDGYEFFEKPFWTIEVVNNSLTYGKMRGLLDWYLDKPLGSRLFNKDGRPSKLGYACGWVFEPIKWLQYGQECGWGSLYFCNDCRKGESYHFDTYAEMNTAIAKDLKKYLK